MISTARAAVLGLAAIAFLPSTFAKPYPTPIPEPNDLSNGTQLEKRDCGAGLTCGYYGQLCCYGGQTCGTNANNEAICIAAGGAVTAGGWEYYTSIWVETGPVTRTSVYSSWVGATVAAQPTATCVNAQSPCGSSCCASGWYCGAGTQCVILSPGSSGGIIATGTPTTTVPFETPIATGVTGVPIEQTSGGGGLSGGAIAGIVIGVLFGLFLLFLLCLFCCFRALFDTIMACFGGGRRKHIHEETYIEEHRHSSGGAAAAGNRRWYGQGPARPPRSKKSGGGFGNALGIGALLGGAALALGLKRKHDRKHDDKSTTISGSSAYYSDDYTSSSSASSSDRHTRHTRQSSRR